MELLNAFVIRTVMTCIVGSCSTFHLSVTPAKVELGIEASLQCSRAKRTSYEMVRIVWIRILKKSAETWTRLAEYREMDRCVFTYGEISGAEVSVSAKVGAADSTYLAIRWRAATDQVYGTYRCDVIGIAESEDLRVLSTAPFNISGGDGNNCSENDRELWRIKSRMEELSILAKLVQEKQLTLSTDIEKLDAILSSTEHPKTRQTQLNETENEVDANDVNGADAHGTTSKLANYSAPTFELDVDLTSSDVDDWPKGSYALLMPETGCPNNASNPGGWIEGFYVFQMEADNLTRDETVTHAAKPLYEIYEKHHAINLLFCMITDKQSGSDWPMGTYCVGRNGGQCPLGFSSGFMRLTEEENRTSLDMSDFLPDVEVTPGGTRFHFCCRRDRKHSEPMRMPKQFPFFLYRHGGECQGVDGMTFVQESLTINTENDGNLDAYENLNHPDGQLDDAIVHLCYYDKDKNLDFK